MSTNEIAVDWVEQVGKPAYESIAEMVAALEADRERLEELREERERLADDPELAAQLSEWEDENGDELAELVEAVTLDGDEVTEDEARDRITEDALSVRVFGERVDGEWTADRFELLLTTGGPAVRIMGELDGNSEPDRAWLEVQDWHKPWTQYIPADQDVLLAYCRCFCFE